MKRNNLVTLAGAAALLLIAGVWLSSHRAAQLGDVAGGPLFTDLKDSVGDVEEIRFSKGDGSRTTLRRTPAGWTVVERHYPADPARVRELLIGLIGMKIVEHKTSDPANYSKLGVESPDKPTASSTLVEVVAGKKTWPLIVGKGAEGRAAYVRKPAEKVSELVEPAVSADPDQKRWIDRLIVDLPSASVHDIAVKPASGPAYLLARARRGDADLALGPIPKGRAAASAMSLSGQAETLAAFNFDDERAAPATPAATDHATFRTFDGQVFEFAGRRDGEKAFITVNASNDAALAAQFAPPAPAAAAANATKAVTPTLPAVTATPAAPAKHADIERLAARAKGVEYEIPVYKYESLFKPQEELLEKKAEPPAAAKPAAAKPPSAKKTLPTKKP